MKEQILIWGKPATPEYWNEWMEHIGAGPTARKRTLAAQEEIRKLATKLKEQQERRENERT